jgi:hypothetical protein
MPRPDKGRSCPSRAVYGSKNPAAKLNEDQVLQIRGMDMPCRYLARMFDVAHATISAIRRRDTWSWLE